MVLDACLLIRTYYGYSYYFYKELNHSESKFLQMWVLLNTRRLINIGEMSRPQLCNRHFQSTPSPACPPEVACAEFLCPENMIWSWISKGIGVPGDSSPMTDQSKQINIPASRLRGDILRCVCFLYCPGVALIGLSLSYPKWQTAHQHTTHRLSFLLVSLSHSPLCIL